jgi:hypothetical protein
MLGKHLELSLSSSSCTLDPALHALSCEFDSPELDKRSKSQTPAMEESSAYKESEVLQSRRVEGEGGERNLLESLGSL